MQRMGGFPRDFHRWKQVDGRSSLVAGKAAGRVRLWKVWMLGSEEPNGPSDTFMPQIVHRRVSRVGADGGSFEDVRATKRAGFTLGSERRDFYEVGFWDEALALDQKVAHFDRRWAKPKEVRGHLMKAVKDPCIKCEFAAKNGPAITFERPPLPFDTFHLGWNLI